MAGWLYMQDCGGRWRRVVSCIMNNAKAEPQAVPVLPLGWLNDSQSRKNRWLAVHAPGSRACHILCVYYAGLDRNQAARRDWFSCFQPKANLFDFSHLFEYSVYILYTTYSVANRTSDRWLRVKFETRRSKDLVFTKVWISREFENCYVSIIW